MQTPQNRTLNQEDPVRFTFKHGGHLCSLIVRDGDKSHPGQKIGQVFRGKFTIPLVHGDLRIGRLHTSHEPEDGPVDGVSIRFNRDSSLLKKDCYIVINNRYIFGPISEVTYIPEVKAA